MIDVMGIPVHGINIHIQGSRTRRKRNYDSFAIDNRQIIDQNSQGKDIGLLSRLSYIL